MDKRLFVRIAMGIIALAGIGLIVLPGLNRVGMVATFGVITADTLSITMRIIGAIVLIGAIIYVTRGVLVEKARKLVLPSADETDPEKIRRSLTRVAKRYPGIITNQIATSLMQLEQIQQSLTKVSEIFRVNPTLFVIGDEKFEYGKFQILLEDVRQETCRSLVRIVYKAYSPDEDKNSSSVELAEALGEAIQVNESRVKAARELVNVAVDTTTQNRDNFASVELKELLNQLANPTRKELS